MDVWKCLTLCAFFVDLIFFIFYFLTDSCLLYDRCILLEPIWGETATSLILRK